MEVSPRGGEVVGEVIDCMQDATHGGFVLVVKLRVVADAQHRMYFRGDRLVPGAKLRLDTEECIIDGLVAQIEEQPS